MSDWRSVFCGQDNPTKLLKLEPNYSDLAKVLKPEDSLIDVGCNIGEFCRRWKHNNYLGIDISAESVKAARERNPGYRFEICDLFDLLGTWDIVLCSRVLMHLPRFSAAVKALRNVTRKHCVLFVPMSVDECYKIGNSYFRMFSEQTIRKQGECVIYEHQPYSTVIYGPGLS
jgi:2-polyprenyl-3-methyl-5-hydroxy-6-metoxy-1,4-benzoquinol methylase